MELDLDALDALAASATPGPWRAINITAFDAGTGVADVVGPVRPAWRKTSFAARDAVFIAAARDGVVQLIAEVRRLRAREESLLDSVSALNSFDAPAELVAARARAEAAELERDRLRAHITNLTFCADNGHVAVQTDGKSSCAKCGVAL